MAKKATRTGKVSLKEKNTYVNLSEELRQLATIINAGASRTVYINFLVQLNNVFCQYKGKAFTSFYRSTKINVSTIPPSAKYNPFRKTSVLGMNIQKADKTKNNSATPKKIFRK